MKNLHTRKTSNGSNFGRLIQQMSINQKSGRQSFRRRFVSGSLFVSPCPPECNFQSETKIEPDLRLSQRHHPLMNKAPISLSRVVSTCFVNLFCWIYIDSIESILFESMSTPPRPIRAFASSATLVGHWSACSIECVVDSFIDVCLNSVCYYRFCCF